MRKLFKSLLATFMALAMLSTILFVCPMDAKAAPYWEVFSRKVTVSPYDKYSSTSSAFKNIEWEIFTESELKNIANLNVQYRIVTNKDPALGDIVFGMDTDNVELAMKALSKMIINNQTPDTYVLQQIVNYPAVSDGKMIVVRFDPFVEQKVSFRELEVGIWRGEMEIDKYNNHVYNKYDLSWDVIVKNPRTSTKVVITDSYRRPINITPTITYYFDKARGTGVRFSDLNAKYTYVDTFRANVTDRTKSQYNAFQEIITSTAGKYRTYHDEIKRCYKIDYKIDYISYLDIQRTMTVERVEDWYFIE